MITETEIATVKNASHLAGEFEGVLLKPNEHVLPTLERDGTRRWIFPKLSTGPFWKARRLVAYILLAIFTLTPHLRIAGKPAVLLDLPHRRFTILGFTFLPTDTLLLALAMVSGFVVIFLTTALVGRVWCGWACPQTVYMEFVFRPIDRLLGGTIGKGGKPQKMTRWRYLARVGIYILLCAFVAHTALAYFVGTEELARWMQRSPLQHPMTFVIMVGVTGLMMFDFLYFREQLCLIACPYGRFQSVMLDRRSLIVAYDHRRGEPRSKGKRDLPVVDSGESRKGDCVDCGQCVHVCPTGIDIRNGLQMECINCTQCIDACNVVMAKVGQPKGLIRYSCQDELEGRPNHLIRPRLFIYPTVLLITISLFLYVFSTKQAFDVTLLRNHGSPFITLPSGEIENSLRLKLVNRTEEECTYEVSLKDFPSARVELVEDEPMKLLPGETKTFPLMVIFPARELSATGQKPFTMLIRSSRGVERPAEQNVIGPWQNKTDSK